MLKIHRLLRSIIATLLEVQVAISYRFVKIIWVIFSVKLHFGRLCKLLQTPDVLVTSNLFQKSVKWQIIQNNHPLGVIICRCRLFHFFCRLLWNCNNRPPINCNNRCIFITKNHVRAGPEARLPEVPEDLKKNSKGPWTHICINMN